LSFRKKILFISGPTSSGKSSLAMRLATQINGEIINADSMQVYKDLRIITARPSIKDHRKIKHHLYGHKLGSKRYNVYDWCNECSQKLNTIVKESKVPIVVGGTGLYFSTLINGIANIPNIPEEFKIESNQQLVKYGWKDFYNKVKKIDKKSCVKINNNDSQRLKHIWEVVKYTNIPLSSWQENSIYNFIKNYKYKLILLLPNREELYKKCNNRFKNMIENGAVEEVENLKSKNYDDSLPIMKAHGVPEIIKYISGKISLEDATLRTQQATRNYIKRQFTWWNGSKIKANQVFYDFPSNIQTDKIKI